jgi:hypothetical protein
MELQKEKTQIIKKAVANIQIKMEISSMVLENKIKVMVKILPMDHYLKKRDQDHQRENFLDKMEKVKVKILDLQKIKIKMENQIQSLMVKMENQIVKIKIESQSQSQIQIQNLTVKMAKIKNRVQNQIVKMLKIQNPIKKMAINPQKNKLQTKTV